jgi:hypothetical protein
MRGHVLLRSVHSSSTRRRAVRASWHRRCCPFLHQEVLGRQVAVLDDLNHRVDKKTGKKPKAKPPTWRGKCRWENPPVGWRNAPALILR